MNSSSNTADKDDVCKSFKNMCFNQGMYVSVIEVMELLRELSSGKASGMDGLTMNKNKNKNKFISEQKMKFDDNEILLINILLETHTMGTTAIT